MSTIKRITLYFIFLLAGITVLSASPSESINFSYISLNDGLSQSTVFSIDQDKRGNMWFATYDGVNKYDGYAFTVYQHSTADSNSISNDIARVVKTDAQGRVWVGTRDGLSLYDEEKDLFRNFYYRKGGKNIPVNGITEFTPEQLLISTNEGLLLFNINESKFTDNKLDAEMRPLVASTINKQGDEIYIGTHNGLYIYSLARKKLELLIKTLEGKRIQATLKQSPTRIWVAT